MEKKIMKMKQEIAEQNRFYGVLAVLGLIAVCAMSSGACGRICPWIYRRDRDRH